MEKISDTAAEHHVDYVGAKMGMWVFLFTELLLFGGLFLLYSVYRLRYAADFHRSAAELDIFLGTANTVILLTSSLSMVCSLLAMKKEKTNLSLLLQIVTILSGVLFLVNKFIEWSAHIERGIYPDSPVVLAMSGGEIIFYSLYYVMTGIHGLHVLVGVGLISATVIFTFRRTIGPSNFVKLENTGLYWHFVDIIWIYLFPLFYLIT